jgi:DNA repair protein RecO (recombination protein O)
MEAAYVLHTRPWRETSLIAELFTPDHGRVGVVARGARRGRRGAAGTLQPFTRLRCAWRGRGELRTLITAEPERPLWLTGDVLAAGLYLNELLMRLIQREDAHPALFALYAATLERLAADQPLEAALRGFEFGLLDDLGYGMPLTTDVDGHPLLPDGLYRVEPDAGPVPVAEGVAEGGGMQARQCFRGAELLGIAAGDYQDPLVRPAAKRLARLALAPHLGSRPLRSRALFAGRRSGRD